MHGVGPPLALLLMSKFCWFVVAQLSSPTSLPKLVCGDRLVYKGFVSPNNSCLKAAVKLPVEGRDS